ncbi:hypothetical protein LOZ12_003000 [Ophidiomyces ophidiicola]|uniref:Uncharacterized protein n=1 Tax=Ophidiomyces ophidiicola TaxID=1387563 RepID=A0ACB8UWW3_9EURO|nr:hypothetical protein LOZ64_006565 [Ophidiomyces ophidiicola]KAI1932147.1 hypothetical protein LOZ62_006723 [Ophidiomyces ophidiicola]KAI1971655.1 hypothetical protein LOZ56_002942 [Ophidiomyces ophidiicola]KAI2006156.1 hypothetical protein LOZ50_003230 [Ophidiomyces ophidiicola]KAI2017494.1 hypothetical protein LOZ46_004419 [Ophidiomyces ophidiicola]
MGSHRYSELGRSLGLFNEQLPWYWKLFVSGSAWLLLAGFLIFPLAMESEASNLRGNRQALIAVSLALVVVASVNCVVYCVRWRKTYEFIDFIFLSYFGSSIIGLFNLLLNIMLRRLPIDTLAIAAIVICSIFALGCGIAVLYHWRDEFLAPGALGRKKLRGRDTRVDDTELQRRQLLKLLSKNSDRAPSPDVTQNTFRIDLPDPSNVEPDEEANRPSQRAYEFGLAPPSAPTTSYNPKGPAKPSSRSSTPDTANSSTPLKPDQPRRPRRGLVELGDL